ncbi:IS4 family transposase [Pararhizobium sp. LjRoot238]|uniref:IS4 family transposase n=1 Tax=Pararhizobium sp. LjRoot238 TaxID=3342293 RepID=UPI003ECD8DB4
MMTAVHTALMTTLSTHFALSKSRLLSLVVLIAGLAQSRTVNLSHLASHLPGSALYASNYRRLQRFFQFVRLDTDSMALLVVQMLNLERPKCLALDRTNWKIGSTDVNILMLAIVTRRFRVPLLWTFLPHQGNSDTGHRIALMRRYLALFDAASITMLLADREFIGAEWMDFLCENKINFVIRVKIDMTVTLDDGRTWSFASLLRRKRARTAPAIGQGRLNGTPGPAKHAVHFAAKRLKSDEWLIVVTNRQDVRQALNDYRKRWAIECLFGDAKTRGLNLEDTRIRSHDKLSCLLVVVTLAMAWAYRCATKTMGIKAIKRKTHGRREKSWFRIGLDALRNWIINAPANAIKAWCDRCPIRPKITPAT